MTHFVKSIVVVCTYLAPLILILIATELIYLGLTRKKVKSFQEAIANLGRSDRSTR